MMLLLLFVVLRDFLSFWQNLYGRRHMLAEEQILHDCLLRTIASNDQA
jgi:hypothetical protein